MELISREELNIDPCKGCEDYVDGECISKGGCGKCEHCDWEMESEE